METISVIIPCYNSQHSIRSVVEGLRNVFLDVYDYQFILVNDYSKDNVWQEIIRLCEEDKKIVGLSLSRNFGQQSARMAALSYVEGDYVLFTDDDGQHPAEGALPLIEKLKEGFDIVYADFQHKKKSKFREWGSRINGKMMETLMNKPKGVAYSSFFVVRRFVADALKEYQSPFPYLSGYFMSITRNVSAVPMEHQNRIYGKSNYSLYKLIALWMNGFTSFSVTPLRIADIMGFVFTLAGFISGLILIIRKLIRPEIQAGYTSLMVLLLIIGGMIMLILGLMGEYVGRMFMTMNRMPQYVLREEINAFALSDRRNIT